jgi:hypothetical protein
MASIGAFMNTSRGDSPRYTMPLCREFSIRGRVRAPMILSTIKIYCTAEKATVNGPGTRSAQAHRLGLPRY